MRETCKCGCAPLEYAQPYEDGGAYRTLRATDHEPDEQATIQLEALRRENERLKREVGQLRYWNEAVAVCREHVDFIVSVNPGVCVICDLGEMEEALRTICDYDDGAWAAGEYEADAMRSGLATVRSIARRALAPEHREDE